MGNIGRTITNLFQINKIYKNYIIPKKEKNQTVEDRPKIIVTTKMKQDIRYNDLVVREERANQEDLSSCSSETMSDGSSYASSCSSPASMASPISRRESDPHEVDKKLFNYTRQRMIEMETIRAI